MGTVAHIEPFLTKRGIADFFGCSPRWIENRMHEGLPCVKIAGRVKFRASECESWLRANGHIEDGGAAA